jgi:hypothetical protein
MAVDVFDNIVDDTNLLESALSRQLVYTFEFGVRFDPTNLSMSFFPTNCNSYKKYVDNQNNHLGYQLYLISMDQKYHINLVTTINNQDFFIFTGPTKVERVEFKDKVDLFFQIAQTMIADE